MTTTVEVLKPQKTWSHLAGRRRRPSEYEIVSTNLHFSTDNPDAPFELDPNFDMALWFKRYRNASLIAHPNWDAFRDPDEVVYRTYNLLQDGQETYVFGLFSQFADRGHDAMLGREWVATLSKMYSPCRYLFHGMQMMSAYLCQMAPASTISNCATYQTADSLRWLTHTAYRTKELSNSFSDLGLGTGERLAWETNSEWQGFRELLEKGLVVWDWAECFIVLNLVLKPIAEECLIHGLGELARRNSDTLLGLLADVQMADATRHRRWAKALTEMALEQPGSRQLFVQALEKWMPLADAAADSYCSGIADADAICDRAKKVVRDFHTSCGIYSATN